MFKLSGHSLEKLKCVHPDLVSVVKLAIRITPVDFRVLEGLRSQERQDKLFEQGKTKTRNSRHLTGHAVDLGAIVNGKINWSWQYYEQIANAMKTAAHDLKIPIEWGGDWKTFKDGVHFQLPKAGYVHKLNKARIEDGEDS